jgi:tripartite-type tricarboxylate transporter receptor subunit TctC
MVQTTLNEKYTRPVVLLYRVGAGGDIATRSVANSDSDDIVLLLHVSAYAINQALSAPDYDTSKIVPLVYVGNSPLVLASSLKSQLGSYSDWQRATRPIAFGSAGAGSITHLYGELFKIKTRRDFTHVPYKGMNPVITDLVGGHIDWAFIYAGNAVPYYHSKEINVVAVASDHRLRTMPAVPTFNELGLRGLDFYSWYTVFSNKNKYPQETKKIQKILLDALTDPARVKTLNQWGVEVAPRIATVDFINTEVQKYKTLIKEAKIIRE